MNGPDRPAGGHEQRVLLEDAVDRSSVGHPDRPGNTPFNSIAGDRVPGRPAFGAIRGAYVIEDGRERIPASDPSAGRDESAVRRRGQQQRLAPRDPIPAPGIEHPRVRGVLIPFGRLPHAVVLPSEVREKYVVHIAFGPMDNNPFGLRQPFESERDGILQVQYPFRHPRKRWRRGAAKHTHQADGR